LTFLTDALRTEANRLNKIFLKIENLQWLTKVNGYPKRQPNCVRVLSDEALTNIHEHKCVTTIDQAYTSLITYFTEHDLIFEEVEDNVILNHNNPEEISIYTLLIRIFEIEKTPFNHWYDELRL
jgi:hypothetical protein